MGIKEIQSIIKEINANLERYKGSKKLKGNYPPFSFLVNDVPKTLKIKTILSLGVNFKNFYLIELKNFEKDPKNRYFLANSLASQSSDLLVSLAKGFITEGKELKLIQYSLYPNTLRINLLLLIELDEIQTFSNAVEVLTHIRQEFRKKLDKITTLMENE